MKIYEVKEGLVVMKIKEKTTKNILDTSQTLICGDSRNMSLIEDDSVHLIVTSPPYWNIKDYSVGLDGDLGNVDDLDEWFEEMEMVWKECYRVLAKGRKIFINIMNVPVKANKSFYTLNITGRLIDQCVKLGFIFKRDIVWHKTHGVRAHFGSYPYPGGILLNNMHEYILEFEKPCSNGHSKYKHLTVEQKENSILDKDFWLSLKNSDVWSFAPEKANNRVHIAPFPEELPRRLILAYSYIGELVLDPFAGSFTTSVVAAKNGRNGIGYEINPEIVLNGLERLKKLKLIK